VQRGVQKWVVGVGVENSYVLPLSVLDPKNWQPITNMSMQKSLSLSLTHTHTHALMYMAGFYYFKVLVTCGNSAAFVHTKE
jgi:hypothetical protein